VLFSFNGTTNGGHPRGSLMQASDGNFYGMTFDGGSVKSGLIFKYSSTGIFTVLKNLDQTSGYNPSGNLIQSLSGALYGMAYQGGLNYSGTIFKITTTGTFAVVNNLSYTSTGAFPYGSLIQTSDGYFYGMTSYGGASYNGTIFKMATNGTVFVLTNFDYSTANSTPFGDLVQAKDGNFYGMTSGYNSYAFGTIIKVTSAGVTTTLKEFNTSEEAAYPRGNLVVGTDGNLYGMTSSSHYDAIKRGSIFKITPAGTFTMLRTLNPLTDGQIPLGSLVKRKGDPIANALTVSSSRNVSKKITLTSTAGKPHTFAVNVKPLHGSATILKDTLTYTPAVGYSGPDSLYFTVKWGCQTSKAAKLKMNVSPATASASFTDEESLTNLKRNLAVSIYPNPSGNYFNLQIIGAGIKPISVIIVNLLGEIVETKTNIASNSNLIFGQNLKPGIYYIQIIQGNQKLVNKIIKSK
jgi:uncharacterized repeat protein (TIGR03803 family)